MFIGLTGYAQSGKDTIASILVNTYGFTRVAFADRIRELLYKTNPLIGDGSKHLKDFVDEVGWDEAKRDISVRSCLQNIGLAGRELFGKDFWVMEALSGYTPQSHNIVITDVRFVNEAAYIKNFDTSNQIWRVVRPDVGPVNNHVSELEMATYEVDQIIVNAGNLSDLELLIRERLIGQQ